MLPKKRDAFKPGWGVLITAGALGLGLFVGSAGPSWAQDKQAAPSGPQAKDQKEYNEAKAVLDEKDPTKKLQLLDQWKKDYPTTELIDTRDGFYLTAYMQLRMAREAFDMAQQILKSNPTALIPLYNVLQMVTAIKPAPTPADLDTGEKDAITILDNAAVFSSANQTALGQNAQQFAATQTQLKDFAKRVLLAIYLARDANKDDKRLSDELTKLINRDPNMPNANYALGEAIQRILKAENRPQDEAPMFWQFARAIDSTVTGPNALPANIKTGATKYLTDAYKAFHGNTDGLQDLLTQAKSSPFPPAGWNIKSIVDIATAQAAADKAEQEKDPVLYLWVHQVKEPLLKDDSAWGAVMGAGLPGPTDPNDPDSPQRFFNATIISMTPENRPKEILVGIEKPDVADAKLVFENALPGKMEPGEKVQFKGVADSLTKDPFMITFKLDDYKKDMNDTWTGKNPTGRGRGAGRGTGKAAPKQ